MDIVIDISEAWAEVMDVVYFLRNVKIAFGSLEPISFIDLFGGVLIVVSLMSLFFNRSGSDFWNDIIDASDDVW